MDKPIRILHIDDSYYDGSLLENELVRRQVTASVRFVKTNAEFLEAIAHQEFDVILLDFGMPEFGDIGTFRLACSPHPDIPIILLVDPPEEERAVDALRQGAFDYVLKTGPRRLVPAIERAVEDVRRRRQWQAGELKLHRSIEQLHRTEKDLSDSKRIQDELRIAEEKYRRVFDHMTEAAAILDPTFHDRQLSADYIFVDMNPAFELLTGVNRKEHLGKPASEVLGDVPHLDLLARVSLTGEPASFETYVPALGKHIVIAAFAADRGNVAALFTDITERKHMEEALLRDQHRLSLVQEAGRIGVFDWNIVGGQVAWSPELSGLYGIPAGEQWHAFEDWSRLIHPDDRPRVEHTLRDWLVSDRNEERIEYQLIRPDGQVRWMEMCARLVRNSEGRPTRMIGTNLDITERKSSEEALRQSNKNIQNILDNVHDAFYVVDREWKLTYANTRACEMWKRKPEELIGRSLWEVLSLSPESEAYAALHRGMAGKGEETFEMFVDPSGLWGDVSVYATDDGLAVYFHDITDRKKAEETLRRSERLYRAVGETINWGIWVCDPGGKNIYASPSFLTLIGMTQEDFTESGWGRVLHPDDAAATAATWTECLRSAANWQRIHRIKGSDGKYHHVLTRGIAVRDDDGTIMYWAGINLDIDEMMGHKEEMEREVEQRTTELERANKDLESFSSSVTRDLKAPLKVISSFTRLLTVEQQEGLNEKQRQYLRLIQENIRQMNDLVNGLLTFSRITRQIPHPVPVDMRSLVESVIEQERQHAGPGRKVTVHVGELPASTADPVLLQQVFANLISNAFKFTRTVPEPRIEVGSFNQADAVVYYVRDNGPGFSQAQAKKLFQVFHRLHAQGDFEGPGVGLANVRKIIERHGGTVWAEGEVGKGATFYFTLPRHPDLPASIHHLTT
jgi:PAS domain S-box-containing protein